jgi:acetoacetyl-CoA synthetase
MGLGEVVWTPSSDRVARARITSFADSVRATRQLSFETYAEMHRWSVNDLSGFWSAFEKWIGIRWIDEPSGVIDDLRMPGCKWFPGGRLNYSENLLFPMGAVAETDIAVVALKEDERASSATWAELRSRVAAVQSWLTDVGVTRGDTVAALLPNGFEALVAALATTSIGAVWSSCSPDFGTQAALDRFAQIEPKILFGIDGYSYGGKYFDIRSKLATISQSLPSLIQTVVVSDLDPSSSMTGCTSWSEVITTSGELTFAPMGFNDPLWVLYSSGTTGLPKAIVHSHGGILLEHAKQLSLHFDLGSGDRFFWFSTTGWMMWNLLISGLALGSSVLLYDGSPGFPEPDALWNIVDQQEATCMGVGAQYIHDCSRRGLQPINKFRLSNLRTIGSTGSPLSPEGFEWVYEAVAHDVMLTSSSGGTDVCSAFVGGTPVLPVRAGIIPGCLLGCAATAFDDDGTSVVGEVGELVVTSPMPSMPVALWNDPTGSRLREAYFERFPGVWHHGDWATFYQDGSCVIHGRSDATLNRGGVRMGTIDFYRLVEAIPEIRDSLVVDTSGDGSDGMILLFVVLEEDSAIDEVSPIIKTSIRTQLSPRHVPDEIIQVDAIPRTLTGKKCEVPVKRVLTGTPLESAVSPGSLADPSAMTPFVEMAQIVRQKH